MQQAGIVLLLMMLSTSCSSVPKTFQPEQPLAPKEFSHKAFEVALSTHVQGGQVDYAGFSEDPQYKQYLVQLNRVNPNHLPSREARLAFWVNAYNAFAIKGIVDGYSPKSTIGRYQYFISQQYFVGGKLINLYDLEKKLLIPDFEDPRIHFAIVCASQSCPKLQSWAYRPKNLKQQLEQGAREFINDPKKNWFDRKKKVAYLSKIFDWFEEDFERHSGSLLDYVKAYLEDPELVQDLDGASYQVEFLDYDWALNGIAPFSEGQHARLN